MEIGTVARAMKLGIVLKDQIGKTLTINFGVLDHLGCLDGEDSEDAEILSGLEPFDTLTKQLLLTDDLEEVLERLDKLFTLVTNFGVLNGRHFYFEGFTMSGVRDRLNRGGMDRVTVDLRWGS